MLPPHRFPRVPPFSPLDPFFSPFCRGGSPRFAQVETKQVVNFSRPNPFPPTLDIFVGEMLPETPDLSRRRIFCSLLKRISFYPRPSFVFKLLSSIGELPWLRRIDPLFFFPIRPIMPMETISRSRISPVYSVGSFSSALSVTLALSLFGTSDSRHVSAHLPTFPKPSPKFLFCLFSLHHAGGSFGKGCQDRL